MDDKKVDLIAYACGDGAQIKTCAAAADFLRKSQIKTEINNSNWLEIYKSKKTAKSHSVVDVIFDYCNDLADKTYKSVVAGNFPAIFGGDHSMAMGSWSGVARAVDGGDLGLVWIDAHMDSHTPKTSKSGAYHGMPLATLMGYGDEKLCAIAKNPAIKPENICLVGIRSYEKEEKQLLDSLGVKVFYMQDLQKLGVQQAFLSAIDIVSKNTCGFGITIDIDAIDPEDAPGTGSKEKDGIRIEEMLTALKNVKNNEFLKALEIAEFNPSLDKNNKTYELIVSLVKTII